MASEIAAFEAEIKEYKLQLDTVISGLQADPDNAELRELQAELEQVIALTEASIAELKPAAAPTDSTSRSHGSNKGNYKHDAGKKNDRWGRDEKSDGYDDSHGAETSTSSATTNFAINDTVLAKWYSGDRGFYPARITSITGSSTDPVYIVKFKNYDTTETLRAKDMRPLVNPHNPKRKDANPSSSTASFASSANASTSGTPRGSGSESPSVPASGIISAAANINPELAQQQQQQKREYSKVSDGPPRAPKAPKKIKANKELEAGKNKWQDFAAKGKFGKAAKKESMFRTPEGVNGRVGFTGSGTPMRKDATRSRHIYQMGGDDE